MGGGEKKTLNPPGGTIFGGGGTDPSVTPFAGSRKNHSPSLPKEVSRLGWPVTHIMLFMYFVFFLGAADGEGCRKGPICGWGAHTPERPFFGGVAPVLREFKPVSFSSFQSP